MSTVHDVYVVRLGEVRAHENADSLDITTVAGCPCVIKRGQWKPGDLAVYVPIDSLVPVHDPAFAFLQSKADKDGYARIRATRLRGVFSMGLVIPPPEWVSEQDVGTDVRERMGIGVYEPPEPAPSMGGDAERDPGFLPVYDIESVRRWGSDVLTPGEDVVITEKIHGTNARYAWHRGRLWCASRTRYYKPGSCDVWNSVAQSYSRWNGVPQSSQGGLADRLSAAPGIAFYGEVYGQIQDLKYGIRGGTRLVVFDAFEIGTRRWLDYPEFCALADRLDLDRVPELYRGPWSPDLMQLAEGDSVLGLTNAERHVREGWVLRPFFERTHPELGRVLLKLHGEGYLTRKEGK